MADIFFTNGRLYHVRREDGEKEAYFTIAISYKNIFGPVDEQNEFEAKVQEYEQTEIGFSFDSMIKLTKQNNKYIDIAASSSCILPKPSCKSKSSKHIQNTEGKYCFLWCISAHLHKVDTHREPGS